MCQSNMAVTTQPGTSGSASGTMTDGSLASSRRPSKSKIVPADVKSEEEQQDVKELVAASPSVEASFSSQVSVERRAPPSLSALPRRSILKRDSIPYLDPATASTSVRSDVSFGSSVSSMYPPSPPAPVRRSASLPPYDFGEGSDPDRSLHSAPPTPRKRASVKFDKVIFREHAMTVGDHPDCTFGPPVSLDWDVVDHREVDLEHYEGNRDSRRNLRQMQMNAWHRKNLLSFKFGVEEKEMDDAVKEKDKVRRGRSKTRTLLPVMKIEHSLRSVGRKIKRAVDADVRKSEKETKDFVRRHSSRNLGDSLNPSTLAELRALAVEDDQ